MRDLSYFDRIFEKIEERGLRRDLLFGSEGSSDTRKSRVVIHKHQTKENSDGVRKESFACNTKCT